MGGANSACFQGCRPLQCVEGSGAGGVDSRSRSSWACITPPPVLHATIGLAFPSRVLAVWHMEFTLRLRRRGAAYTSHPRLRHRRAPRFLERHRAAYFFPISLAVAGQNDAFHQTRAPPLTIIPYPSANKNTLFSLFFSLASPFLARIPLTQYIFGL